MRLRSIRSKLRNLGTNRASCRSRGNAGAGPAEKTHTETYFLSTTFSVPPLRALGTCINKLEDIVRPGCSSIKHRTDRWATHR